MQFLTLLRSRCLSRGQSLLILMKINAKHEVAIELEIFSKKSLQILEKLVIIDELAKQRAVTSAG